MRVKATGRAGLLQTVVTGVAVTSFGPVLAVTTDETIDGHAAAWLDRLISTFNRGGIFVRPLHSSLLPTCFVLAPASVLLPRFLVPCSCSNSSLVQSLTPAACVGPSAGRGHERGAHLVDELAEHHLCRRPLLRGGAPACTVARPRQRGLHH